MNSNTIKQPVLSDGYYKLPNGGTWICMYRFSDSGGESGSRTGIKVKSGSGGTNLEDWDISVTGLCFRIA